MDCVIRPMTIDDYDEAYRLWEQAGGIVLDESDCREAIAIYLNRNQGLCFVATAGGHLVGVALCGHDGRRGFLRHLAVHEAFRGQGLARTLVSKCLAGLASQGITLCQTFVLDTNTEGRRFWEHMGWDTVQYYYRTMRTPTRK
jgi:N-acetylglutamate synthase